MVKFLFVLNVLLTLPFGVLALAAPSPLFAQFGLDLDAAGQLIARGYGATLVGYGLVLWLMRGSTDGASVRAFLLSMMAFNAIEAVIQGVAGAQGVALPLIWGNAALHGVVAAACAVALMKNRS